MQDLNKALADIGNIRDQLAGGLMFRGYGPTVIAVTGLLALATMSAQSAWGAQPLSDPVWFFGVWALVAVVSGVLIGLEMHARTRRHHGGLADAMLFKAVEHVVPAGVAGGAIGLVILKFAPDTAWVLPGLWQVLIALGIFSSLRFLPRSVAIAGGWYLVAGIGALIISSQSQTLSPWVMGVPFVVGQLLLAGILHVAYGGDDEQDA